MQSILPLSFRDLFMRLEADRIFPPAHYLMAEDINAFFPAANYRDILSLERDLAQLSDLILLFSESYGSAAELGAFAISEEIAERLIVLVDDKNFNDNSFVKLGPLQILAERYGDSAICVLHLAHLEMENARDFSGININNFTDLVNHSMVDRRRNIKEKSTFSKNVNGHILRFSVGIIQLYGALDFDELHIILMDFQVDISTNDLHNLLHCAKIIGWIAIEKLGTRTFFVANIEKKAASLPFNNQSIRRKEFELITRAFWKDTDAVRFGCISRAAAGFDQNV